MNHNLMSLYEINKNGLISIDRKVCLCGEEMNNAINVCPKCGTNLAKTKLLNINKNTALAKRIVITDNSDVYKYEIFGLFSKGFELYEQNLLEFSFDFRTEKVTISDSKIFKSNADKPDFQKAIETRFPNFLSFVSISLRQQEFEYAVTNFSSLRSDQIENFFHIYNSYNKLIPYLMGYKILNYGKNLDLKTYFPNVDFNDEESLKTIPIYLPVLKTYDLKNVKYIETIIDIYKTHSEQELIVFNNCVDKMLGLLNRRYIDGNDLFDTFSVLYNKDISFEDFTRIFLASREDFFSKMMPVKKMLKKLKGKFSWTDIEKIDRKLYGTLCTKTNFLNAGVPKDKIDGIFELLNSNPMAVYDELDKYRPPRKDRW